MSSVSSMSPISSPPWSPSEDSYKRKSSPGSALTFTRLSLDTTPVPLPGRKRRAQKLNRSIVDQVAKEMSEASEAKNGSLLQELFESHKKELISYFKAAREQLFEDHEERFITDQLTEFLTNQLTFALSSGDTSSIPRTIALGKEVKVDLIGLLPQEEQKKFDVAGRLAGASLKKSFEEVAQVVEDCRKYQLPLVVPDNNVWIVREVNKAKIIDAFDNNRDFSVVYSVLKECIKTGQLQSLFLELNNYPRFSKIILFYSKIYAHVSEKQESRLTEEEALHIACYAEQALSNLSSNFPFYVEKEIAKLPRTLIIDKENNRFVVVSEKNGIIATEGEESAVCSATLFQLTSSDVEVVQCVHRVNLETDREKKDIEEAADKMEQQLKIQWALYHDIYLSFTHISAMGNRLLSIVEEVYDAGDLHVYCKGKSLTLLEKNEIVKNIAVEIKRLHDLGYVHYDLKPANVVLKEWGKLKLIDFGCTSGGSLAHSHLPNLIMDETLKTSYGSVPFSAPEYFEQEGGKDWTIQDGRRLDLYAFGCLIYWLLKKEEVPWASVPDRILSGRRELKMDLITKHQEICKAEQTPLYLTSMQLLEPDPLQRLDMERLIQQLLEYA